MRAVPSPQIWARYAAEHQALYAKETERFGSRAWSVEYRPEREPYPFCLIDDGERMQDDRSDDSGRH